MSNSNLPEMFRIHKFHVRWGDVLGDKPDVLVRSIDFVREPGWFKSGQVHMQLYSSPDSLRFLMNKDLKKEVLITMYGGDGRTVAIRLFQAWIGDYQLAPLSTSSPDVHTIDAILYFRRKEIVIV